MVGSVGLVVSFIVEVLVEEGGRRGIVSFGSGVWDEGPGVSSSATGVLSDLVSVVDLVEEVVDSSLVFVSLFDA